MNRLALLVGVISVLACQGNLATAQVTEPISITDLESGVTTKGAYALKGDALLDLYNGNGELLETLRLVRKDSMVGATFSLYTGKKYEVTTSDSVIQSGRARAITISKTGPLNYTSEDVPMMSKSEALRVWSKILEDQRALKDEEGIQRAQRALQKIQARPDN